MRVNDEEKRKRRWRKGETTKRRGEMSMRTRGEISGRRMGNARRRREEKMMLRRGEMTRRRGR